MTNPFYYLFYIIYKLIMKQFNTDDGTQDMPGRVMGIVSLMMLFHFFIIGSYIEKITAMDLSFVILMLLLFYFVSGYYLRVNNRYKKIIYVVENMPLRSRITSISILLCWFIVLPTVMLIFF